MPYVKRCETTLTCRVQLLFSFLDPTSEATACIFPMVTRIMSMEAAELKDKFYGNQAMVIVEVIQGALDDYRWNPIEFQLDSMLPTLSAEQPEALLRKLEKKKQESLLDFATRFSVTASTFRDDQLTEGRKAKLLLTKLPRDLQRQLAILNFEECTIQKLITRVKNYLDWMSVRDQKPW